MSEPRARDGWAAAEVAGGGSGRAAGSVTRSPDSLLFERRAGLGGPTPRDRPAAAPPATSAATHPVTDQLIHASLGLAE